jgi:hypothetical protein
LLVCACHPSLEDDSLGSKLAQAKTWDHIRKITKSKKSQGWGGVRWDGWWLNGKVPAWQAWGPEFKPQSRLIFFFFNRKRSVHNLWVFWYLFHSVWFPEDLSRMLGETIAHSFLLLSIILRAVIS